MRLAMVPDGGLISNGLGSKRLSSPMNYDRPWIQLDKMLFRLANTIIKLFHLPFPWNPWPKLTVLPSKLRPYARSNGPDTPRSAAAPPQFLFPCLCRSPNKKDVNGLIAQNYSSNWRSGFIYLCDPIPMGFSEVYSQTQNSSWVDIVH